MEKKVRLTPLMIARLFGVPVGDGPERRESIEDSGDGTRGVGHPVGDPLAELEERTRAKGSKMLPSVTIGLAVIGMLMVGVGGLLILPISLSLEHARIIWGLGFFAVGVSVIFSVATRARSSDERTPSPEE
ncbi:hypothetical protein ISS39_09090 [Candidatus Bathyarchaeota archaeon]|nr:hypothetical protein [Candidatus Bathyarchaeota archaeon]